MFFRFLFLLLIFPSFIFSQNEIKEGEWEITVKMQMEGMNFDMPATTVKQCIKKENPFPVETKKEKMPDCKILKQEVKGSTVNWEMECKEGKNTFYSKGSITYKGNSFEGKQTMEIKGEEEQKITQTMNGKYLGPCK